MTLELAGPERQSFTEIVGEYRRWLGWNDARLWYVPRWLGAMLYRLGYFAGLLDWRPPMRSTARLEIARGAFGDPAEWMRLTGIKPRGVRAALASEPASVQERWFASLYFLKALIFVMLPLFWIATGLLSIGPGHDAGTELMQEGGAGALSGPLVIADGVADIAIGLAIAMRRTTRLGLYAALALTVLYVLAGSVLLPRLWLDPLGSLLKVLPVLALNLVSIAIVEDR